MTDPWARWLWDDHSFGRLLDDIANTRRLCQCPDPDCEWVRDHPPSLRPQPAVCGNGHIRTLENTDFYRGYLVCLTCRRTRRPAPRRP